MILQNPFETAQPNPDSYDRMKALIDSFAAPAEDSPREARRTARRERMRTKIAIARELA